MGQGGIGRRVALSLRWLRCVGELFGRGPGTATVFAVCGECTRATWLGQGLRRRRRVCAVTLRPSPHLRSCRCIDSGVAGRDTGFHCGIDRWQGLVCVECGRRKRQPYRAHLLGRSRAGLGLFRKRGVDEVRDRRWHIWAQLGERWRLLYQMHANQFAQVLRCKRKAPREGLVGHHGDCVEVRSGAHALVLAAGLFRRHVCGGADQNACGRAMRGGPTRKFRDAEVEEFGYEPVVLDVQKHIVWLDVAVNNASLMRCGQCLENRRKNGCDVSDVGVWIALHPGAQGFAKKPLHGKKGTAVGERAKIEHFYDVRMVESRYGLRFNREACDELWLACILGSEHFDCGKAPERGMHGGVHCAHATIANQRGNLEVASKGAEQRVGRVGIGRLHTAMLPGLGGPCHQ